MDPHGICMTLREKGQSYRTETDPCTLDLEGQCLQLPSQESNLAPSPDQHEIAAQRDDFRCYVCQESASEDTNLKQLSDTAKIRVKNAADLRKKIKSDKYHKVTRKILVSDTLDSSVWYHTSCHRCYTAVKRPKLSSPCENELLSKKACIETRRSSVIPKSDQKGLLKGSCIFCGKSRKKRNGKEEPRLRIATIDGCESISRLAKFSKNKGIKGLICSDVDLIAKEAEYHKSCRAEFLSETDKKPCGSSSQSYHKVAFASLVSFIENEVIGRQTSHLVSDLLAIYKEEYISVGGEAADIEAYSTQNLTRKIKEYLGDKVKIQLADQRKGNFVYSSVLSEEHAKSCLQEDAERYEQDMKLRWAALHLRSVIMQLPKTKTPNPATVKNIKDCSPHIPKQLDLFFRVLLGGTTANSSDTQKDAVDRKVTVMASDAIYNVTRGAVKPWKQTTMGIGFASLTGSKLAVQLLNRMGHSISYSETKGLETEFAYSVEDDMHDAPDGIQLNPNLATACVWDNNDANVETLDGKGTLHATVGHTYQNIVQDEGETNSSPMQFREGRNRRSFDGNDREIQPFRKSIRHARFPSPVAVSSNDNEANSTSSEPASSYHNTEEVESKVALKTLDMYWFWQLLQGNTPLHAGFMSTLIVDPLPLQRICYMDPIPKSPTNNDVVKETMLRTINIAKETGQDHAIVTYDLAVASKAYAIQAVDAPLFDKLLIMLGNFHIELAFFDAVGTLINESGMEFILTEANILAEGSMMGFMKGKFYNRCTRIHELLSNVLEQKLYQRFLSDSDDNEYAAFIDVMSTVPSDPKLVDGHLSDPSVARHLSIYNDYFQSVLDGKLGSTAQFWAIYIFLINRLHRELQRCIKTNNVIDYISIFPMMLAVFFALNRPNYARWGTLFLEKLKNANPTLLAVLENGAFSIRRTKKNYSRSAVDLSLEQTVNRDAASCMKGIVAFRSSENAMRRWSLNMTQRAMAVTELRSFVGLELGESPSAQNRPSRIKQDNNQMTQLSSKIDEFCNPFANDAPATLVNVATGQAATEATQSYLLGTLKRGEDERDKFKEEWENNSSRFLQPVKRTRIENFATQNAKKKTKQPASQNARANAESLRDMFVRMMVVVSQNTAFDLQYVLSYPITAYPLSLAHCDGSHIKTEKSALLRRLEACQTEIITESEVPRDFVQVYDGGLLLHSILSQTNTATSFASIARTLLSLVCSGRASEVHVCLDKYVENSIKESERRLRGANDFAYVISGPEQKIRQHGKKLLTNGTFKNELARFLLKEWGKDHYHDMLCGKTLVASHGGECFQYVLDEHHCVVVSMPEHLQGDHEEADTLIGFHIANINLGQVVVRASDTDVLVILIGIIAQQRREVRSVATIIMDCGMANNRRYINVTNIVSNLDEQNPGLPSALPGYHAFTGSDFTSAFYRQGKTKPLQLLQDDTTSSYIDLFIRMGEVHGSVDMDVVSQFVCRMYGQNKSCDVNEARYRKLTQMSGKVDQENPLSNIRRIDCALLPPSRRALEMKVLRSQYVTTLWKRASSAFPGEGLSPTDYGWFIEDNLLRPVWFEGPAIPSTLFPCAGHDPQEPTADDFEAESNSHSEGGSDDEAWSEHSDSEDDIGF